MTDDIADKAKSKLVLSSYREIRSLVCEWCEGTLTIKGVVPTYHLKQTAQELLRCLEVKLNNQIEVQGDSPCLVN